MASGILQPHRLDQRQERTSRQGVALKAVLCVLIGLGVLISPYFIQSPGMQGIVAKASLVGWFALVLGIDFGVACGWQMMCPRNRGKEVRPTSPN